MKAVVFVLFCLSYVFANDLEKFKSKLEMLQSKSVGKMLESFHARSRQATVSTDCPTDKTVLQCGGCSLIGAFLNRTVLEQDIDENGAKGHKFFTYFFMY
jgi:hypothetical protein